MSETEVEHWWNGTFGRLSRVDIYLRQGPRGWQVEFQRGGKDSRHWWTEEFTAEAGARDKLAELIAETAGSWVRI